MRLLFNKEAKTTARSLDFDTLLHCAAGDQNKAIVQQLLDTRARPTVQDSFHETAMQYAAGSASKAKLKVPMDGGADVTTSRESLIPLHYAAGGGDLTISKLLTDKGAKVKAHSVGGTTPLHWAFSSAATARL